MNPIDAQVAVAAPSRARRGDAVAGALAMAPLVVAYVPFALVIGSTAATIDDPRAGWAGSWLIYSGSAHLAALHGIAEEAPLLAIATALLVNARLLVYGASMAPRWRDQPRWFRLVAPTMLVDPTWALADGRAAHDARGDRRFFLAAGIVLGTVWSTAIAAGAVLGDRLPEVGLELAAPLCLIALVGPRLRDRSHRHAATVAALAALATHGLPAGTAIAVAIAAGSIAGRLADRTTGRATAPAEATP